MNIRRKELQCVERDDVGHTSVEMSDQRNPTSYAPAGEILEEWKSVDELARSTIRMHLVENVYFSTEKKKTMYELSEKLKHYMRRSQAPQNSS